MWHVEQHAGMAFTGLLADPPSLADITQADGSNCKCNFDVAFPYSPKTSCRVACPYKLAHAAVLLEFVLQSHVEVLQDQSCTALYHWPIRWFIWLLGLSRWKVQASCKDRNRKAADEGNDLPSLKGKEVTRIIYVVYNELRTKLLS